MMAPGDTSKSTSLGAFTEGEPGIHDENWDRKPDSDGVRKRVMDIVVRTDGVDGVMVILYFWELWVVRMYPAG